jgi:phospholipase C
MPHTLRRAAVLSVVILMVALLIVGAEPAPAQQSITPIQHVVIIVQENHSFDNYFGTFPGANGIANAPAAAQAKLHPMTSSDHDMCHTAACIQADYNGGKMNGFNDSESYGYYTQKSIPYYWSLAQNYTLMDNYFSGFLGPSLPNRVVMIAGSNYGGTTNQNAYDGSMINATIFDLLNYAGVSWKYYTGYSDSLNGFNPLPLSTNGNKATDYTIFKSDVENGRLPSVSWLQPQSDQQSEHPPYNITDGITQVKSAIATVMKSSYWSSTAILLTWDEGGAYYDHVAPPSAQYGMRVPMIIISPWTYHGFVDHTFSSHLSTLAMIEDLFNLPCMKLDCKANDLMEAFTFTSPLVITQNSPTMVTLDLIGPRSADIGAWLASLSVPKLEPQLADQTHVSTSVSTTTLVTGFSVLHQLTPDLQRFLSSYKTFTIVSKPGGRFVLEASQPEPTLPNGWGHLL